MMMMWKEKRRGGGEPIWRDKEEVAQANNIRAMRKSSDPHVGEESGRGRSFRRRHIGTAGEALQPSAVPLTRSSQDWW